MDGAHSSDEHFYQLGLRQFGAFSQMRLEPPPDLRDLLEIAVEHEEGIEENGLDPGKVVQVSFLFLRLTIDQSSPAGNT